MDPTFVQAYQAVSVGQNEELMKARWGAIESIGKSANAAGLLDAARVFYGLPSRSPTFLSEFRHRMQTSDSSYPDTGTDHEVRILCGAVLSANIAPGRKLAMVAALALVSGYFRGHRSIDLPTSYITRAREYLIDASGHRVKRIEARRPPVSPKLEDSSDAAAQARASIDFSKALSQFVHQATRDLETRLLVVEEETNIFWWLFAGYSKDLEKPMAQLNRAARPLVAGKEMADLISLMPGPIASPALLDKFLADAQTGATKTSPVNAIKAAELEWIIGWARGNEAIEHCSPLCPTLLAAQRYAEAPDSDAWVSSVISASGINIRMGLPPLELALQIHDEFRLVRAYREATREAE